MLLGWFITVMIRHRHTLLIKQVALIFWNEIEPVEL
ncbi:Uncharacterised protein [Vibrio cholerae]|nr:Uncharacterised protein [Vibrio cholerae]CSI78194.1 Uncharacterised protein [Vibrio cholerae]